MNLRATTRTLIARAAIAVTSLAIATSCSPSPSTALPLETVATLDDSATSSTISNPVGIQDRSGAAVIDVCLDTGPETQFIQGTEPVRLLSALADLLAGFDLASAGFSRGLAVHVWVMEGHLEGIGPIVDTEIPDIVGIDIPAGVVGQQLADLQARQAAQRARATTVRNAQSALEDDLRSAHPAQAASSDVLHCISRANAASADLDPARRLFIIAGTFPLQDQVTESVTGDLSTTRQILLLTYGPDTDRRQQAWSSTWDSLGATRRYTYPFDDGVQGPLREAIAGILS